MADYASTSTGIFVNDTTANGAAATWLVWNTTVTASTTAATMSNTNTWTGWNGTNYAIPVTYAPPSPPTPEQLAEQERQRAEWKRQAEERKAKQIEADARAEELLRTFLTPEQEATWEGQKYFDLTVEGGDQPPRRYRIERGSHGNIKRLDAQGKMVEYLCIQPRGVPTADINLAQMLHLLHDEEGLRGQAGIQRVA